MTNEQSKIRDFFKNQTVLLTGGSGFVGKVLIEKLLRECHDLKAIYVLLRPKKGLSPEQRFSELFSYPCFDGLKALNSKLLEKVSLVDGDCNEPSLGISDENLEVLKKETTCVIHAAANVKFDQSLKEAAANVRATKDMLELAKRMPNLRVFVYVSTAFSNCINPHIKEQFYEPPLKADNLFELIKNFDDDVLEGLTPKLLGKWPNTYVYTKCISESVISAYAKDLPLTVVRPGIIFTSMEEPMPGWIDNFYGLAGLGIGVYLGVLRSLCCTRAAPAHVIPVDYVCNCILAAARKRENSGKLDIYNYVGHKNNVLTYETLRAKFFPMTSVLPSTKTLWYPSLTVIESRFWYKIFVFFSNTLPAYIIDFILMCFGKPTLAVENCKRLHERLEMISSFLTSEWSFDDDNVLALWDELNNEDKKIFRFNMGKCNWTSYLRDSIMGGRIYLLKDPIHTLPQAEKKSRVLFVAHYSFVAIIFYLMYKLVTVILSLFW